MYYIYWEDLEKNCDGKWVPAKIEKRAAFESLDKAREVFSRFGGRYLPDMLRVYACVNYSLAQKSGYQVYLTEGLIEYEDLCEVLDIERFTWDDLHPARS